jgi:hypothetical protein
VEQRQVMSEITKKLETLKSKYQAGRSTLDELELEQLLNKSISVLKEVTSLSNDNIDADSIAQVLELLNAIIEGEFSKIFTKHYEEEKYYNLGQFLLSLLNIESNSDVKKELVYQYLNLFRNSEFLIKITDEKKWTNLLSTLIDKSNFNTKKLFAQRVKQYKQKTLFKVLRGKTEVNFSWSDADDMIKNYA